MIRAVTFDFWDTIVIDESDEIARKAMGLAPKREARWQLFHDAVAAQSDLPEATVRAAFDAANDHFRYQWKVEHHTPHIRLRLQDAFARLDLVPGPGFDALVAAVGDMEVVNPPLLAPGIAEALAALKPTYKLGVISDTIVTPGTGLRTLLSRYELFNLFDFFVFSDEVGASKPAPAVFHAAAIGLGVDVSEIAHVGDREENDVIGPRSVGARGILYTGVVDRGATTTLADAVCAHHHDLPGILAGWEAQ